MKKLLCVIILFAIVISLCSCTPREVQTSLDAMDTFMKFTIRGGQPEWAMKSVENEVKTLDRILSVTETGDIGLLNEYGQGNLSKETIEILNRSLDLCAELDGALDITVYPLVREWGFISGEYKIPSKEKIKKLLSKVDYRNVKVTQTSVLLPENTEIDLGAVAKGFLADKCMEIVESEGSQSAIFNLGGTIAVYGDKPDGSLWKVAITDPDNTAEYFGFLSCKDAVVATSGGYERYFEKNGKRYIHIIDPKTGYPVDNGVKSVTIVSEDGMLADALSTAFYVMGVDKAAQYCKIHKGFDVIILSDDNKIYISRGIADSFTLADGYSYEIVTI